MRMSLRRRREAAIALLAAVAQLAVADARAAEQLDAEALLRRAFANQYELDSTAEIELVILNAAGQQRSRLFEAATKIIDGRMHSIGRLTRPEHLRGMTILQVEARDGGHDAFVYLPSMHAVRRVSTAQRGDAFFGTDLCYEDLERRHARDYRVTGVWQDEIGEPVAVVAARPRRPHAYHAVHFWIALEDAVILRAEFFKQGGQRPFRSIEAPREAMTRERGHTLPTRLRVANRARGTTTEVYYRRLRIDPEIDDRVFSVRTLERRGRIPGAP